MSLTQLKDFIDTLSLLYRELQQHMGSVYNTQATPLQVELVNYIGEHPDSTVPQIAKARHTSRQNIQVVVNELLTLGILTKQVNPRHKRSYTYRLSRTGTELFGYQQEALVNFLQPLAEHLPQAQLSTSTDLLHSFIRLLRENH